MTAPAVAPAGRSPLRIADENSRHASQTLAFAQPGDTLLYLLLPLHHDAFGVTLAEAGLLLAANRLVRIAGYGWVARFYAERGLNTVNPTSVAIDALLDAARTCAIPTARPEAEEVVG